MNLGSRGNGYSARRYTAPNRHDVSGPASTGASGECSSVPCGEIEKGESRLRCSSSALDHQGQSVKPYHEACEHQFSLSFKKGFVVPKSTIALDSQGHSCAHESSPCTILARCNVSMSLYMLCAFSCLVRKWWRSEVITGVTVASRVSRRVPTMQGCISGFVFSRNLCLLLQDGLEL